MNTHQSKDYIVRLSITKDRFSLQVDRLEVFAVMHNGSDPGELLPDATRILGNYLHSKLSEELRDRCPPLT